MTKTQMTPAITALLLERWEQSAKKIAALAEALPEDKFEWQPTPETRTPSDIVRHVAFWNRYVADVLRGKAADDSGNELSRAEYASKAAALDALNRSAADVTAAIHEQDPARERETAERVAPFVEHTSEHYGQLVVYARMLGVVPPASRG